MLIKRLISQVNWDKIDCFAKLSQDKKEFSTVSYLTS